MPSSWHTKTPHLLDSNTILSNKWGAVHTGGRGFYGFIYGSYERVIEPAVPDGNKQADQQQRCAKSQGGKIPLGKGALGVPGALAIFAKATQLHGVADGINAVQAGQNQRQQNTDRILEPCKERFAFAQLHAAGLLGLADAVVVALNIRDIAQRNGNRVAHLIGDADAVQACGKLAGVSGGNKQDSHRQCHKVFERDIDHVEQLLRRYIIPPEQMEQHMPRAVQRGALVGVKQKDEQVIQQQEYQHKDQHKPHFAQFDVAELERRKADGHQPQQHPSVIGDHAGKGKQQKECQLGGAGHFVNNALARQVIEHGISSHVCAPPCLHG